MNYVITTCSQQIYTRAYLLLYLLSGGTGMHCCYPLGIWSRASYLMSRGYRSGDILKGSEAGL